MTHVINFDIVALPAIFSSHCIGWYTSRVWNESSAFNIRTIWFAIV